VGGAGADGINATIHNTTQMGKDLISPKYCETTVDPMSLTHTSIGKMGLGS